MKFKVRCHPTMTSKNLHPGLPRESPHCHSLAWSPVRLLLEVGSRAQQPTLTKPIKTVIDKHSVLGKPWDFEGDSLYVAFYPSPSQGHSPIVSLTPLYVRCYRQARTKVNATWPSPTLLELRGLRSSWSLINITT